MFLQRIQRKKKLDFTQANHGGSMFTNHHLRRSINEASASKTEDVAGEMPQWMKCFPQHEGQSLDPEDAHKCWVDVAAAVTPALMESDTGNVWSKLESCIDELWVQLRDHTSLINSDLLFPSHQREIDQK